MTVQLYSAPEHAVRPATRAHIMRKRSTVSAVAAWLLLLQLLGRSTPAVGVTGDDAFALQQGAAYTAIAPLLPPVLLWHHTILADARVGFGCTPDAKRCCWSQPTADCPLCPVGAKDTSQLYGCWVSGGDLRPPNPSAPSTPMGGCRSVLLLPPAACCEPVSIRTLRVGSLHAGRLLHPW